MYGIKIQYVWNMVQGYVYIRFIEKEMVLKNESCRVSKIMTKKMGMSKAGSETDHWYGNRSCNFSN